ncbi:MAG: tryptophan--tRNA ligase, partial [Clostridia bacterium]|nr:tryptophan--tRNA ligase [Clostridia bacterium]
ELAKDIPAIWDMLYKGSEVARAAAAETLADVKKSMKIDYFADRK